MHELHRKQELLPLTDSLASRIRWRYEDYEAMLRAEVAQTSAPIQSYFAQVADDPSVQLVSQAQLAYLKRAVQGTAYEGLPLLSAAAPFKTGGRLGWNEPPPAAITTTLQRNTSSASLSRRKLPSSSFSSLVIMRLKWNCGPNGAICCIRLSVRPCPVTIGKPGMS